MMAWINPENLMVAIFFLLLCFVAWIGSSNGD